ncbi:MAG: hypothetical protein IJT16_00080 [Lachnospiraceae bacterium]|nr:hypothetical protein [Lachnospiraceae bacterium]
MDNEYLSGNNELVVNEKGKKENVHTESERLRAAYALNMCTVSVSQIIDYNDGYILEQEYDAILNNLDLNRIIKDDADALLNILTELLDTITFFRIQEIKKEQIEKKYQQRMKNAIWSAIPSLSLVALGNPIAIATSIITTVGTGYMNYRKEKANALNDKADAEIELQITAIEQFNALRRELFTTAWRLAKEYDFDDKWRLTEKQIKQYNAILMDKDEYRKYARLEAIADRFEAYPPFWYFYGHTANYIAETATDQNVKKRYKERAKEHFEHYDRIQDNNILREDQLTASFALEYIDLLWEMWKLDKKENRTKERIDKIENLLNLAIEKAGNSFDILQLCAISCLKIGNTSSAARQLKILVNEGYNVPANARLLSRIYTSQFLFSKDDKEADAAYAEYKVLEATTDAVYLFPIPDKRPQDAGLEDRSLQKKYVEEQKYYLKKSYRFAINSYIKKCISEYNKLWPVPYPNQSYDDEFFDYTVESKIRRDSEMENVLNGDSHSEYVNRLYNSLFRKNYLDLLNNMMRSLDELSFFRDYEDKDDLVLIIRRRIVNTRNELKEFQNNLREGKFSFEKYKEIQESISFQAFTEEFFNGVKSVIMDRIDDADELCENDEISVMSYLDNAEIELKDFCRNQNLEDPEEYDKWGNRQIDIPNENYYFGYSILGDDMIKEDEQKNRKEKMLKAVRQAASGITHSNDDIELLITGEPKFDMYFKNVKFGGAGLKPNIIAIIDDKTKKDYDMLLAYNGFIIVDKNKIKRTKDYRLMNYITRGDANELGIGWPDKYANPNVNIANLYDLVQQLVEIQEKV